MAAGKDPIKPEQVRMARAALGWSLDDLQIKSRVHRSAVWSYENGKEIRDAQKRIGKVKATFEAHGITFVSNGVRYRNGTA